MFDRMVETSDALRKCEPTLIPALCGCSDCRRFQMIAAPVVATCPDCGSPMTILQSDSVIEGNNVDAGQPAAA